MSAVAITAITKSECFICITEVSKSQMTKCLGCEFECCTNCFKYHIENSQKTEKNCMNCKIKIPRSTLVKILGKSYIDKMYRTDIKELLFKEEMLLVPRSLPEVEKRKKIKTLNTKITTIQNSFVKMLNDGVFATGTLEYFEERGLMNGRIAFYSQQANLLQGISAQPKTIKQYKYPCENPDCNGFVDSNWVCSICEKETCKRCHTIKEVDHECKQEDIDTADLIKKDSKSCPKCNISIMKTSGCDQMWCISCHTTFDWKTMQIKTSGVLHNPEYFRYMRENGIAIPRNPNDNPCMDEYQDAYHKLTGINSKYITEEKLLKTMRINSEKSQDKLVHEYISYNVNSYKMKPTSSLTKNGEQYAVRKHKEANDYLAKFTIIDALSIDFLKDLFRFYREINHMESIEIRAMRTKIDNAERWKDEQRVEFLDKSIDEDKYKKLLTKRHKELEYLEESIGFHTTIVEASKAYFIAKINTLDDQIKISIADKTRVSLNDCNMLSKLRDFIKEVNENKLSMKRLYGYTQIDYIPKLLVNKTNEN